MHSTPMPIKFPHVRTSGFTPDEMTSISFFGLAHVRILPPRKLKYPLLGCKINDTLCFTCCFTCARDRLTAECVHDDWSRSIVCTYSSRELAKALSLNYRILEIFELWDFPHQSSTLFTRYVLTLYKKKEEASGWASWVQTEEDKQCYLQSFRTVSMSGVVVLIVFFRSLTSNSTTRPSPRTRQFDLYPRPYSIRL